MEPIGLWSSPHKFQALGPIIVEIFGFPNNSESYNMFTFNHLTVYCKQSTTHLMLYNVT